METLRRIKTAIQKQRYQITAHANEEMSNDNLISDDVERIINTGTIIKKLTHDPRGTRYEIEGNTLDGRRGIVVCRFFTTDALRIITAYTL